MVAVMQDDRFTAPPPARNPPTGRRRPSHEGSDGSSKFIFDLMEPERPKVDRAVLRADGVCRLNPEMARIVVAKVSTKVNDPTGRSRRKAAGRYECDYSPV